MRNAPDLSKNTVAFARYNLRPLLQHCTASCAEALVFSSSMDLRAKSSAAKYTIPEAPHILKTGIRPPYDFKTNTVYTESRAHHIHIGSLSARAISCTGVTTSIIHRHPPPMNTRQWVAASAVLLISSYELWLHFRKPKTKSLTLLRPKTRGIASLIGNTPMIEIESLSRLTGCKIYAKLELMNPAGSAKDRVALAIIRENERLGKLKPHNGDIIFEGTSGSTGISFTVLANALGYTAHICLPSDTSPEKLQLLKSLGAELEPVKPAPITDPRQYTNAARAGAKRINDDQTTLQNAIFADQFENDFNWRIHFKTTGPEIWSQMEHDLDFFVTGSGTGGTIAGVSKYLKQKSESIKIVLADPQGSGLANRINFGVMYDSVEKEGKRRRHQVDTMVEGVGLNRLTWNFKQGEKNIDEAIRVTDEQAIKMAKFLCVNDGLFWGSSAAINCVAAVKTALKYGPNKKIVIIACDSGDRHLSKFWKAAAEVPSNISLEEILEA